ncbi:MAG: hypothetical protein LBJ92_01475 [Holosporales bacterium]|jgi:hypothetical protein|nr:hypothetical protein [Holosporales bacterium]
MKKNVLSKVCVDVIAGLVTCQSGDCMDLPDNLSRMTRRSTSMTDLRPAYMPTDDEGVQDSPAAIAAKAGIADLSYLVRTTDGELFGRVHPHAYFTRAKAAGWHILSYVVNVLKLHGLDMARIARSYTDITWATYFAEVAEDAIDRRFWGPVDIADYHGFLEEDIEAVRALYDYARRIFP